MQPLRKQTSYCHARLPYAGLGNKLLVWARAFVFAQLNCLPLVVSGWSQPHPRSLLRGNGLRFYWNYFRRTREVSWGKRAYIRWSGSIVREPPVGEVSALAEATVYEFSNVPDWMDYFKGLKGYPSMIRAGLSNILTDVRRREFERAARPVVAMHIRMGDFRPWRPEEDFRAVGAVRTPLDYFSGLIGGIREVHGSQLPVTIFSDGDDGALGELLEIPRVEMAGRHSAITDMLLMAASRVLVTSAGSTFGYWGGFLGEGALIMHSRHVYEPIRAPEVNRRFYEGPAAGPASEWPELLRANICAI